MALAERAGLIGPGEGTTYAASGAHTSFKVRAEETQGMFELTETSLPIRFAGPCPRSRKDRSRFLCSRRGD